MKDYFNLCESIASCSDKEYTSIKDLVTDLAIKAGYYRKDITLKNGKVVTRTQYTDKFDDILVSKWFLFYKKLFYSKLYAHPELKEYYSFILQRTFSIYMNSLQFDKLINDASVTKAVNMSLINRIGEALGLIGSKVRLDDYNSKQDNPDCKRKTRLILKTSINHMAMSLDELMEINSKNQILDTSLDCLKSTDTRMSDIITDIHTRLNNNKVGFALLEAMLNSNKKINFNKISDYLDLEPYKDDINLKHHIADAAIIISNTLKEYTNSDNTYSRFNKTVYKNIKFNETKSV